MLEDETYHNEFPPYVPRSLETVVAASTQRLGVYIRGEIAHGGRDALIECAAECQVSAKAHARCANPAVAGGEREESRDGDSGVFVVGVNFLGRVRRRLGSLL